MRTTTLAGRLRWARDVADISQSGLSKLAGLAPSYVGLIEAERRGQDGGLGWDSVRALSTVLGVSPEWLMDGTGPKPSEDEIREAVARARTVDPIAAPTGTGH